MFRGRDKQHTREVFRFSRLFLILLIPAIFSGCIFSPDKGDVPAGDQTPTGPAESAAELIQQLAAAYRTQDIQMFESLLANQSESAAEYLFFLSDPEPGGEDQWDFTEEVRIHQRMFDPDNLPPGEPEVPSHLWLESITITLTPASSFSERPDLYASANNPGGLSDARWKALDARYTTFVFFDTSGQTDFLVEGEANFVVVEDLEKAVGDEGKFLLLRWEDLRTGKASPDNSAT